MSNTIIASGVPFSIADEKVEDFFSFCGKINSVSLFNSDPTSSTKSYKVEFKYVEAVSTALLLNGAELGGSQIYVLEQGVSKQRDIGSIIDEVLSGNNISLGPGSLGSGSELTSLRTGSSTDLKDREDIPQEEKPKSAIIAEYLSKGYVLSDSVIEKAILFDQARGISESFKSFLGKLNKQSDKLNETNEQLVSSDKVAEALDSNKRHWNSYYYRALNDEASLKVHGFYTSIVNDAQEIRKEAARLANMNIRDQTDVGKA